VTPIAFFTPLLVRIFLATARFGMFVVISPMPARDVPTKFRAAVAVVLAVFAANLDEHRLPVEDLTLALVPHVITEILIGGVIGFTVRIILSSAEVLGGLLGQAVGLSFAQIYDPGRAESTDPLARITTLLAMGIAFGLGAHRIVLGYLLESMRALPLGGHVAISASGGALFDTLAQSFEAGVRLGLPALAISVITQLAVAFVSRAAPALQIFSVGMSVTAGAALLVVIVGMPDMAAGLEGRLVELDTRVAQVATLLVP